RIAGHEEKAPPRLEAYGPGGAAAREEVEDEVAGARRGLHDPPEHAERLLGRIAGAFLALSGHDGVPPGIGGQLAPGRLLGTHEAGRHVGDALHAPAAQPAAHAPLPSPPNLVSRPRPP